MISPKQKSSGAPYSAVSVGRHVCKWQKKEAGERDTEIEVKTPETGTQRGSRERPRGSLGPQLLPGVQSQSTRHCPLMINFPFLLKMIKIQEEEK